MQDPAIDRVLQDFKQLGGNVTVDKLVLSCRPLPTVRSRVFIIISTLPGVSATDLVQQMQSLAEIAEKMPRFPLSFFMDKEEAQAVPRQSLEPVSAGDVAEEAADLSKYHAAFSQAIKLAAKKKRLPQDLAFPASAMRPSSLPVFSGKTPWLKAQADVYYMIAKHKLVQEEDCTG